MGELLSKGEITPTPPEIFRADSHLTRIMQEI